MKNDSLSILRLFTRKLANCRYRVAPATLIEELKTGCFGYTIEEGEYEVVNNDYVLADDFEVLLESIRAIFREPRLFLQKENIVQHSENASKFDNSNLKATYKDEKLWRYKDGDFAPEYVHSFVYEDDYAIYENKFICFVIDEVYQAVVKKINELVESVETVNRKMGGEKQSLFTTLEYVNFIGEEIPTLVTDDNVTVGVIRSLLKTKKWLVSLKNTPLYKACKRSGNFNPIGLKPTNILLKDTHYRFCYDYYLNYFNKDKSLQTEDKMFYGYAVVNLMGVLDRLGFELEEDNEQISISNLGRLKFSEIKFKKAPFSVVLSQLGEDGIMMTVKEIVDGNEAKYLFRTLNHSSCEKVEGFSLDNHIRKAKSADGVVETFIINDVEDIAEFSSVYVVPNQSNSVENLTKAIKYCFLLALGSEFMHKRFCPVCGSKLLTLSGEDCTCTNCGTRYHVFKYEEKDLVWFKKLPTSFEYDSANELRPEIDEVALTEDDGFAKSIVSKTFMQKLWESTSEIQGYYNQLKNTILGYKKVKSKVSRSYDRFNLGRNSVAKIGMRGKTLVLYLPLNPQDYENTKYFPKDMSDKKKYADTPMMVKVKSERGLKFAIELIEVVLDGVPKNAPTELIDYVEPQIPAEELEGSYIKKSFVGKLCQAETEVQEYYSAVKNILLSYKKVNSRVSFSYDSFNLGRKTIARFGIRGKTLVLYLALNPDEYVDTKYFVKNVGDVKKYTDTPAMVKVKSGRGVKYAGELIEKLLEGVDKKTVFEEVKYFEPYKSDAQLISKGLAKIVKTNLSFN